MATLHIITGNRLDDGRVAYLTSRHDWSADLQAAQLIREDADQALANTDASSMVEAYLIEVTLAAGQLQPVAMRERYRAAGPSAETPVPVLAAARHSHAA